MNLLFLVGKYPTAVRPPTTVDGGEGFTDREEGLGTRVR